ncbi:unannotated protein [freshwater metagenome]|uniref:Unannotated protein n=1 Tax=freshwater metagenome TaxID=449393 RepID=A0A6J6QQI0_9ZZZZ
MPWQVLPHAKLLRGRSSASATRRAKAGLFVCVSTPCSGWWKLSSQRGRTVRRKAIIACVSGSDAGFGPDS